jgi:hypothetical protein
MVGNVLTVKENTRLHSLKIEAMLESDNGYSYRCDTIYSNDYRTYSDNISFNLETPLMEELDIYDCVKPEMKDLFSQTITVVAAQSILAMDRLIVTAVDLPKVDKVTGRDKDKLMDWHHSIVGLVVRKIEELESFANSQTAADVNKKQTFKN